MDRLLPLTWTLFGASIVAMAKVDPAFFIPAIILAVVGAIMESEA